MSKVDGAIKSRSFTRLLTATHSRNKRRLSCTLFLTNGKTKEREKVSFSLFFSSFAPLATCDLVSLLLLHCMPFKLSLSVSPPLLSSSSCDGGFTVDAAAGVCVNLFGNFARDNQ